MTISKKIEVDFAHRLINHNGLCKNFHGHRYVFEAFVSNKPIDVEGDSSEGMVIDFKHLKSALKNVIEDRLDHSMVITVGEKYEGYFREMANDGMRVNFVDYISTVENMGKDVFKRLQTVLQPAGIQLVELHAWETPTSKAVITQEDIE